MGTSSAKFGLGGSQSRLLFYVIAPNSLGGALTHLRYGRIASVLLPAARSSLQSFAL